jgi:hypothetical protein
VSSRNGDSSSLKTFSEGRLVREQAVTGSTRQERSWDYGPDGSLLKQGSQVSGEGGTSTSEVRYSYDQKGRPAFYTESNHRRQPDGSVTSSESSSSFTYGIEGSLRLLTSTNAATGQRVDWYYEGSCY